MNLRTLLVAGAATVLLTAASLTAVAMSQGGPSGPGWATTGVAHGPSRCQVPASLPGTRVTVMLGDMGRGGMMGDGGMMGWMMLRAVPQSVPAGPVSLVAYNHGFRRHEVVILPLSPGASVGSRTVGADNKVDETGSLGETSRSCGSGAGEGIAPGAAGWVTLTLKPGRYELLCNLRGHYASGMYDELVVT